MDITVTFTGSAYAHIEIPDTVIQCVVCGKFYDSYTEGYEFDDGAACCYDHALDLHTDFAEGE